MIDFIDLSHLFENVIYLYFEDYITHITIYLIYYITIYIFKKTSTRDGTRTTTNDAWAT